MSKTIIAMNRLWANQIFRLIAIISLIIYALELVSTAWLGDDSLFTIRTILNWIDGYGPVFNIGDRVQAYTHPLWFLVLSPFIALTNNIYFSVFFLSITLSLFNLWFLTRYIGISMSGCIISITVLIFSKAFVDYSTSGLENPLSHFCILLTCYFALAFDSRPSKKYLTLFFVFIGLIYLTRQDLILLITPLTLYIVYKAHLAKIRIIGPISIASVPVILWLVFSIIYYGFPFPNTAYAKLGTGIERIELIAQSRYYFLDSLQGDPITLIAIIFGFFIAARSPKVLMTLALGVAFYLAYIAYIGGDFMGGRFFTAPLLVMCIVISRSFFSIKMIQWVTVPLLTLTIWNFSHAFLLNDESVRLIPPFPYGIADEQRVHHKDYSIRQFINREPSYLISPKRHTGFDNDVVVMCHAGVGLKKGLTVHVVDPCGLADPLLARLPARRDKTWRIGHFERELPVGYLESLQSGHNLIVEDATHNYYDYIQMVTKGSLLSWDRMKVIGLLNLNLIPKPKSSFYQYGSYLEPIAKGQSIIFSKPNLTLKTLGWQNPEGWGTWSDGHHSRLALQAPDGHPKFLKLRLRAFIGGAIQCQQLIIKIRDQIVFQKCLSKFDNNEVQISIPSSESIMGQILILDFELPSAASPKAVGLSESDNRILGIGLQEATFE